MVQIAIPYAYGRTICVYAYGMEYVYGTQHMHVYLKTTQDDGSTVYNFCALSFKTLSGPVNTLCYQHK